MRHTHTRTHAAFAAIIALLLGAGLALGAFGGNPVAAAGPTFTQVDAGGFHACGLLANGRIECWGDLDYQGENDAPIGSFSQVSAGDSFSCAIRASDKAVVCWGNSADGRLNAPAGSYSAVSAGANHACGIKTGGAVVCWGKDDSGDTDAPTNQSFSQISTGYNLSCGIVTGSGNVVCWGDYAYSENVAPSGSFTQVSISYGQFACGLKADHSIVCWGSNLVGEGNAPAGSFTQVTVGIIHSCALKSDGSVVCWGGNTASASELTPPAGVSFTAIDAGDYFTCGITTAQSVVCWGDDHFGNTLPPTVPAITSQPHDATTTVGQSFTLSAAASGKPAPTYQWFHNGAPISNASGSSYTATNVTMSDAGSYDVVASNQIGGDTYSAASQSVTVTVNKATPTITWPAPAAITYGTPLGGTQLNATASVGATTVPGTFSYDPAAGTILGAGTQSLTVQFTPADTTNYTSASATVQLTVNPATPTITWNNPAPITYGTPLSETQLDATASVPGSFSYAPAAGTVLNAGVQTLSVSFTPEDQVDYTTAQATVLLTVQQATPTIIWSPPVSIGYGSDLSSVLNAGASVPGSFSYTLANGTPLTPDRVLDAGSYTLTATFTPSDTLDYASVSTSAALSVTPAPLTVKADDQTKLVGEPNPALTGTIAGLQNGDPISATYATPATVDSPAGSYPIVPALVDPDGRLGNYVVTVVNGTLTVKENLVALFDQSKPIHAGSTAVIAIQLMDASGNNISSPDITLHAVNLESADGTLYPVQSPGNSQPGNNFRYGPTLGGSGGYSFNLKTTGLPSGVYTLHFTVGDSPTLHEVQLTIG